jgi:hypothetical protein
MSNFCSQQLPSERENEEKKCVCGEDISFRFSQIQSGLDFILSHFDNNSDFFPRKIMTAATVANREYQVEIYSKEITMRYFEDAKWQDCRISAFHIGQKNPNLIFVDLDRKHFSSDRALKAGLTKILRRIKSKIGGHPTVLWSGRGFHIIQPIKCDIDLYIAKELADLVRDKDVNKAFLQFGSRYLSNDKSDKDNHTSLKSCLLRTPGSINSKSNEEVRIIQQWDGYRPSVDLLIGSFYSYLVDKREEERKRYAHFTTAMSVTTTSEFQTIGWIEKLLQTPLDDYRKHACDLILIPYLVIRKGMTDPDQIIGTIMQWAGMCDGLCSLDPSLREFEKRVESRVYEVMQNRIPPMRWDTLQQENPDLVQRLSS